MIDAAAVAAVAAPGTDPALLARVLVRLVADAVGTQACFRDALRRGRAPAAAIRAALAPKPLPGTGDVAVDAAVASWGAAGVRVSLAGDPAYPQRLLAGGRADLPLLFAVRGRTVAAPAIALVGMRRATGYGRAVAAWLAEAVALAGVGVVSGGAVGVDGAAHEAALAAGGHTTVVLGCGHAVAYPRPHARPGGLFPQVVAAGGAIVSELLPDVPPRPHHVRDRNRIVAALADLVVVVEGGARSGALLTAAAAADRGVPVLAVPGDVRAPGSAAPHRLLLEGAAPCTEPADLLDLLGRSAVADPRGADSEDPAGVLPAEVARVLAHAWPRAMRVEELARAVGLSTGGVLAAVTRARVVGVLAHGPDGVRLTRRPRGPAGAERTDRSTQREEGG